ncbi:MAG: glycosyltransferase family 9 protein [Candidatus Omnitrophica bacterium]|nr:glycosyltransferase family 9 protein [Candidatus Omnitrophota bacterium]
MVKNILIIGHSNIGDVCYNLVVVKPLLKHFPQAKISFLTSPRTENIVQGYEGVDKVFTFNRSSGFFGRLRLMSTLVKNKFDLAIILKSTLMYKFLGIPCSWSIRKHLKCELSEKKMHVVDILLEFLRSHGISAQEAVFGFGLGQKEKEFCDTFFVKNGIVAQDKLVGILPLSAWTLKSWPADKWYELVKNLKNQYGVKVIAFGKRNDFAQYPMILDKISSEVIVADQTTLRQAMSLINRCRLFIGPDSGLLHLASCMGGSSIGLYGPTPRDYIFPYFHRDNMVSSKQKFHCMPCYPALQLCPCKGKFDFGACMESINVEDVVKLATSLRVCT